MLRQSIIMPNSKELIYPNKQIITPYTDTTLKKDDVQILNTIQNNNHVDINDYRVKEWIRCRSNPIYFILNYVYLQEIGGKLKYNETNFHLKLRRVVRVIFKYRMCLFMASRQLGKSSIAAAILAWASIFFPNTRKS